MPPLPIHLLKSFRVKTSSVLPEASNPETPALASPMRPSPAPNSRPLPIPPTTGLQLLASTSICSGAEIFPLPYPATESVQGRDHWHFWVTREDPCVVIEPQDSVARFDRSSREIIVY
ncbi:hypothetical protein O181_013213 [Austropuccinia psidii MF-1]|uniref:Uncharacterized protein n=1 Tax=Austropuccinia psidii MF-1 TaxID=1389203 RepID=A0A9Q3GMW5_9BASI|nr:hypothetical protein [Austropuccinia psidii MF-1]